MTNRPNRLEPKKPGRLTEGLGTKLRRLVIGQDEAIQKILDLYQMYATGMTSPGRPIGNILFLGPTGSGKTRLVEAAAECFFGDAAAIVKIDCAEFQHSHEVAKLIGSPPGYLGHRETHPFLSQEALNRSHTEAQKLTLVLFDEIEKASDSLWNLLLGILDKATLTLGDGRKVDFSKCFIFMTSNLGATEMQKSVQPRWGFSTPAGSIDCDGVQSAKTLSAIGLAAARNKFTPEFINRLDAMVVFQALGEAELRQIAEIELRRVQQRIVNSGAASFAFQLTEAALEHVLADGTDPRYGARHLKRAIDRLLVQPLSNLLATEQVRQGDCLRVDSDSESREMVFFRQAENLSPMALARLAQTPVLSFRTRATVMPDRPQAARAARYAHSGMESQAA